MLTVLREPEVAARLRTAGFEVKAQGRAAYRALMEADTRLWGGFIREANIRQD